MKKRSFFVLATLAGAFSCFSGVALAEENARNSGFYMAPKFVLNGDHSRLDMAYARHSAREDALTAGGALALGYDCASARLPLRIEVEYGAYGAMSVDAQFYSSSGSMQGELEKSFQTLFVSAYWDLANINGFKPYVGGGLGVAFIKFETSMADAFERWSFDNTETVFAAHIGAGCSYAFNDNIALDLGYRFVMMDDIEASGRVGDYPMWATAEENYAHQFLLGLRFTF